MVSELEKAVIRRPFDVRLEVYPLDERKRRIGKGITKDNDLVLDNFGLWLAGLMRAYSTGAVTTSVTMKDTGGVSRVVQLYSYTYPFNTYQATGLKVEVGTGATAPARTDYALQTPAGTATALSGNATWTSAAGTISLAGDVLMEALTTLYEAGLQALWNTDAAYIRTFLLFHDTFGPVVIAAGKYAHVAYIITM